MAKANDVVLPLYFMGYVFVTGLLFLFLPRLAGDRYLMPWDYCWVFLIVTPPVAGLLLARGVRMGWFSGWAVVAFVAGAVLLGFGYWWISLQLAAAV